ncbi:MAG TPA: hypothetical protein VD969_20110 [Symbiobacteriaceae bacterium]|nr:hypothetical protein [Symbiobacteriaceae bacterium]
MRKLTGGKIHTVNPERVQFPLYGDLPKIRVGAPGTLFGNAAVGVQIMECGKQQLSMPETNWVKIVFREVTAEFLLVISAVKPPSDTKVREPDTYPVKYHHEVKAPTIRGLKLLFESARIELRDDVWYEMPTEIGEDDTFGKVVFANWTKAVIKPKSEGEGEAAASKQ